MSRLEILAGDKTRCRGVTGTLIRASLNRGVFGVRGVKLAALNCQSLFRYTK